MQENKDFVCEILCRDGSTCTKLRSVVGETIPHRSVDEEPTRCNSATLAETGIGLGDASGVITTSSTATEIPLHTYYSYYKQNCFYNSL